MRASFLLVTALLLSLGVATIASANEFVPISGGEFRSVVPESEGDNSVIVADFRLQETPITNGEFLRFVLYNPDWQRGNAVGLFVDDQYLFAWPSSTSVGNAARPDQPVSQVSWFAANAYCESLDARLPTWYEWEYVAAADGIQADARALPLWQQEVLSWYSHVGGGPLRDVRGGSPNFYDVFDAHGLVWEWVDDFNALLVTADNREQGGADALQFCGAGAITMEEKENYAVLMRVAMLSSLEARYTTRNLGFRCARSLEVTQ